MVFIGRVVYNTIDVRIIGGIGRFFLPTHGFTVGITFCEGVEIHIVEPVVIFEMFCDGFLLVFWYYIIEITVAGERVVS
jgi:hypothetical protein